MTAHETEDTMVLKARYQQVPGTDVEYGQGAIERNELPHREISPCVWLIRVPVSTTPADWQQRLSSSVDPEHGSFQVGKPTSEEQEQVERGEIRFQQ